MTNSAEISDSIIKQKPQIEEFYEISSDVLLELRKLKASDGEYLWCTSSSGRQTLLKLKIVCILAPICIFRHVILIDKRTRIERQIQAWGDLDHG